jgi:ATP-dependent HslUV protease ATP-binding subunit HslU
VPIYLPEATRTSADTLTPRQIVAELDKYVIGQTAAKRAVAIALRNRMRRQKLAPELAEEIAPKNILMIGPTGVGKTEIARRLARLAQSPFLKVEASKFTEVGYVGRDVESMVRDLVELGVDMVRGERLEEVHAKAGQNAEERLLDLLLPPARPTAPPDGIADGIANGNVARDQQHQTRERFREQLRAGRLDARVVEMDVREKSFPSFEIIAGSSGGATERDGGRSRSRIRSSAADCALSPTSSARSDRTISTASSTRSRTIDSTSRPT